jgi:hypothetical protein
MNPAIGNPTGSQTGGLETRRIVLRRIAIPADRKSRRIGNPPLERHEVRLRGLGRSRVAIPIAPAYLDTSPARHPDPA